MSYRWQYSEIMKLPWRKALQLVKYRSDQNEKERDRMNRDMPKTPKMRR